MRLHKLAFILVGAGFLLLVVVGIFFFLPPTPVTAQCGSQASSCKNCHETQAKDPVNNDGTAWHTQHAFGDFCYLCHGGNNQATDETAAHQGMVSPLTDINTSCKGCHANDALTLAQGYAATLGVSIGTGGATATTQPVATTTPAGNVAPVATPVAAVPPANMVDYSQRYDELALGQKPLNIGNVILIIMIAGMLFGGGYFVVQREGWIKVSFEDPKRISVQQKYPADVVELLPEISRMKSGSRKALHNILAKPKVAADLFTSIDRLSQVEGLEEGESLPEDKSGEADSPEQEE